MMRRFHLKESSRHLTATAGLMLIGQCRALTPLERLDIRMPKRGKIRLSDVVKSYVGLLTLGKSDFEAIEAFRRDRFFQEALGIGQVPGSVWLRQQLETPGAALREHTNDWSVRLIQRSEAPITPENGFVGLDFDTFVMDNSGTKKEWVGRTYQGVDGYTPITAYLGNEGWCGLVFWSPRPKRCCRAPTAVSTRPGCGFSKTTKRSPGRRKAGSSSIW